MSANIIPGVVPSFYPTLFLPPSCVPSLAWLFLVQAAKIQPWTLLGGLFLKAWLRWCLVPRGLLTPLGRVLMVTGITLDCVICSSLRLPKDFPSHELTAM